MKIALDQKVRGAPQMNKGWSLPSERSGAHHTAPVDNKRFGVIVLLALVPILLLTPVVAAEAVSSASVRDVPPSLMQSAECMAIVVRAVPGVTDVQVAVSSSG